MRVTSNSIIWANCILVVVRIHFNNKGDTTVALFKEVIIVDIFKEDVTIEFFTRLYCCSLYFLKSFQSLKNGCVVSVSYFERDLTCEFTGGCTMYNIHTDE